MQLTEKQKEKLSSMQSTEDQCVVALGQIAVNRLNLQIQEDDVNKMLFENAKKRQELLSEIEEELGPGSIDPKTFEFTPKEV